MTSVVVSEQRSWKTALGMMLNPGLIVREAMGHVSWQYSLMVSGLAFTFFFLQTGLDLMRSGHSGVGQVIALGAMGAIYGSLGVALIAQIACLITKAFGNKHSVKWVISAFGLSYSSTLIYALIGLLFSLFLQWNTSVAFGVSGVLWALGPMIATIKEMTGGRLWVSITCATLCGGLLLFGWVILANSL